MLIHVIETSIKLEPLQIYVIVGKYLPEIKDTINKYKLLDKVKFIKQNEPLGTGHAIQCSKNIIKNHNGKVLIFVLSFKKKLSPTLKFSYFMFALNSFIVIGNEGLLICELKIFTISFFLI